jgi:hypothetical protein
MPEVQDIFQLYGDAYRQSNKLSFVQHKAMSAIQKCRTAQLGTHRDVCGSCGVVEISYNSCRNRHCPKCQTLAKERWIENQKHNLLNVAYFHVVFTVPDDLRPIIYQNQSTLYSVMFQAVAETLKELSANHKYIGAEIGVTSILHTWGQNLSYHPHIHCIVTAGGLSDTMQWVHSREKFFIPVKVISRKFRGKLIHLLKSKYLTQKLVFFGDCQFLEQPGCFLNLLQAAYNKEWVVYCKTPFKTADCVVLYLGRYTHRVAISNNRIFNIENGNVCFKWRDYKDNNRWKVMTLSACEFIRRFLMHIMPHGFTKIRHYGLLASRYKTNKLHLCKKLTNTTVIAKPKISTIELLNKMFGRDLSICLHCGLPKQPNILSPPVAA